MSLPYYVAPAVRRARIQRIAWERGFIAGVISMLFLFVVVALFVRAGG